MTGQAGAMAYDYTALVEVAERDPVECARLITVVSRQRGTLPADLAELRKTCLRRARVEDGRRVSWLAVQVGLAISGVSRLTAAGARAAMEVAS